MSKHISKPVGKRPSLAIASALLLEVEEAGGDINTILERAGLPFHAELPRKLTGNHLLTQEKFSAVYHGCIAFLEDQASRSAHRPPMTRAEFDMLCHCVIARQRSSSVSLKTGTVATGFIKTTGIKRSVLS